MVTQAAGDAAEDVEIRYRGQRVPQVTSTRIAFWNAGWVAVQSQDVAPADPIRIALRECHDPRHDGFTTACAQASN